MTDAAEADLRIRAQTAKRPTAVVAAGFPKTIGDAAPHASTGLAALTHPARAAASAATVVATTLTLTVCGALAVARPVDAILPQRAFAAASAATIGAACNAAYLRKTIGNTGGNTRTHRVTDGAAVTHPALTAATVRTAIFALTPRHTGVAAEVVDTKLIGRAIPAKHAAIIETAGHPLATELTVNALTIGRTVMRGGTLPTDTAAPIGPARFTLAIRVTNCLTDPCIGTLRARVAGPARTVATIITALQPRAVRPAFKPLTKATCGARSVLRAGAARIAATIVPALLPLATRLARRTHQWIDSGGFGGARGPAAIAAQGRVPAAPVG